MNVINVLVTGVSGGGVGEQIMKALRLSTLNLKIVGVDSKPLSKGFLRADVGHVVPLAKDKNYINVLLELCSKHKVQVLFPGSEAELSVISKSRKIFADNGILVPINRDEVIDICTDKTKTMDFLTQHGFSCPQSITITSSEDVAKINFFPAVIKPSIGAGGSKDIIIAQNVEELELFCNYMLKLYPEFIVQEYVGTPDSEFTVGVLHSLEGEFINSIAIKKSIMSALNNRMRIKNRTSNSKLGELLVISSGISEGHVGTFPEVTEVCERVAKAIKSTAAINIQCRFYEGKVYIFEINPRYSGTTSLRAMTGYNEPEVMIRKHLLNEVITPKFAYKSCYIGRGLEEAILEPVEG